VPDNSDVAANNLGDLMTTVSEPFYRPLTIETAPEASRPLLESVQKSLGFVPNLMATYLDHISPTSIDGAFAGEGK
jgi:hypothetical protein